MWWCWVQNCPVSQQSPSPAVLPRWRCAAAKEPAAAVTAAAAGIVLPVTGCQSLPPGFAESAAAAAAEAVGEHAVALAESGSQTELPAVGMRGTPLIHLPIGQKRLIRIAHKNVLGERKWFS